MPFEGRLSFSGNVHLRAWTERTKKVRIIWNKLWRQVKQLYTRFCITSWRPPKTLNIGIMLLRSQYYPASRESSTVTKKTFWLARPNSDKDTCFVFEYIRIPRNNISLENYFLFYFLLLKCVKQQFTGFKYSYPIRFIEWAAWTWSRENGFWSPTWQRFHYFFVVKWARQGI